MKWPSATDDRPVRIGQGPALGLCLALALLPTATWAQAASAPASAPTLAADLREEIVMVKKPGVFGAELETTLYRPAGEGPFPLIIVNHGKESGNPRFQARSRYVVAARELVRRGYAVVVPMRQGFSKSSGSYIGGGCNLESNGRVQAEDVAAVLVYYAARADIDARRVVVFGQSHGGFTTLAVGALNLPNVVGLVNFAGGLRQEGCNGWERSLADAVATYARSTTVARASGSMATTIPISCPRPGSECMPSTSRRAGGRGWLRSAASATMPTGSSPPPGACRSGCPRSAPSSPGSGCRSSP